MTFFLVKTKRQNNTPSHKRLWGCWVKKKRCNFVRVSHGLLIHIFYFTPNQLQKDPFTKKKKKCNIKDQRQIQISLWLV